LSKKSNLDDSWIAISGEIKKTKERWLESSKTNLPLVIIGDSGVGKSFWIERSIQERIKDRKHKIFRIDYSQSEEYFDLFIKQFKKEILTLIWWENFSSAQASEIKKWNHWWKERKYENESNDFIYWEIQTNELSTINVNKQLQDLYEQFKSFVFNISPLHRRQSDLAVFINHFLHEANRDLKKNITSLDEHFHHYFTKRNFKHNLHELRDFIYSLVAFSSKKQIKFKQLPIHFFENQKDELTVRPGIPLEEYEKAIIKENLKYVNGNRTRAAKLLGISERNLYRKIKQYQLDADA
jgi:DNA-binding NtrC family response regulator